MRSGSRGIGGRGARRDGAAGAEPEIARHEQVRRRVLPLPDLVLADGFHNGRVQGFEDDRFPQPVIGLHLGMCVRFSDCGLRPEG